VLDCNAQTGRRESGVAARLCRCRGQKTFCADESLFCCERCGKTLQAPTFWTENCRVLSTFFFFFFFFFLFVVAPFLLIIVVVSVKELRPRKKKDLQWKTTARRSILKKALRLAFLSLFLLFRQRMEISRLRAPKSSLPPKGSSPRPNWSRPLRE
jgi:hypothetical protein